MMLNKLFLLIRVPVLFVAGFIAIALGWVGYSASESQVAIASLWSFCGLPR
jgi:predicted DNA-binding transcriptional regulator